jgi:hypothetical protein
MRFGRLAAWRWVIRDVAKTGISLPFICVVCVALILARGSAALSADTAALPEFDFTHAETVREWKIEHDLKPFEQTDDGVLLKISGGDPFISGPALKLPANEQLFLRVRLKSETGGLAQIFLMSDGANEKDSILFEAMPGKWTEVLLALPKLPPTARLRLDPPGDPGNCVLSLLRFERANEVGVLKVAANAEQLSVKVKAGAQALEIVALPESGTYSDVAGASAIARVDANSEKTLTIPRFEQERDGLYSGFVARAADAPARTMGSIHYAEVLTALSGNQDPFPQAASKKGLQVQMIDDALALGVKHAALNVSLTSLLVPEDTPNSLSWKSNGKTFYFNRGMVEGMQVKKLSDAGVQVSLILLNYLNSNAQLAEVLKPPRVKEDAPNKIYAFNVAHEEAVDCLRACAEFIADRFSGNHPENGRVVGYIVGNEVNTHWHWYNCGRAPLSVIADEYLRAVRVIHTAVRKSSASARIYISLDHFWSRSFEKDSLRRCGGRELLNYMNAQSKLGGDFDWHIAYHPYPENLFEPRFWRDKSAAQSFDAPRITFKNLEQLPKYLRQPEQLVKGAPRHVILSEQGFNTPDGPDGETLQAAAYCAAYYKVSHLDGIDAFILHRHVDHKAEDGAKFGLWTRKDEGFATPDRKKLIYDVFKLADTPDWEKAFGFALPIIGVRKWDELLLETLHK